MRNRDGASPKAIKTVKLLKFLLAGNSAEIDGVVYYLDSVAKKGLGAKTWNSVAVDNLTLEAFMELAEEMDGYTYNTVMLYDSAKSSPATQ
jgi:hypothetical protein